MQQENVVREAPPEENPNTDKNAEAPTAPAQNPANPSNSNTAQPPTGPEPPRQPLKAETNKPTKAKVANHHPVNKRDGSVVAAIWATTIIVVVLAALAVYAYTKTK